MCIRKIVLYMVFDDTYKCKNHVDIELKALQILRNLKLFFLRMQKFKLIGQLHGKLLLIDQSCHVIAIFIVP